jgi:hypothetical protein
MKLYSLGKSRLELFEHDLDARFERDLEELGILCTKRIKLLMYAERELGLYQRPIIQKILPRATQIFNHEVSKFKQEVACTYGT